MKVPTLGGSSKAAETWVATEATVTSCRFQFARMNPFTLGIQTGEKFRIAFDYYAHGRLYSDEFQSAVAIPQNERVPISYNPLHPEQNSRTSDPNASPSRNPMIAIGIIGSIIVSLLWLTIIHSCN